MSNDDSLLTPLEARRLLGWGPASAPISAGVEFAQDIALVDGDLSLGEGLDTLRQDLAAALVTALGADPLAPSFGFSGFEAISTERDPFLLRERLRVAVVNVLRRDHRIDRVDQVLIGPAELRADAARTPVAGPPDDYGVVEVVARFRLRGRPERLRMSIGSILGSG